MQKNTALAIGWIVYMAVLVTAWFLRTQDFVVISLALGGSFIGFLLPIVLDVLLPKMMDGSAVIGSDFAKGIVTESVQQIRQGNLSQNEVKKTPLRSYPLLLAYFAATIFIISSTQNWFGRGFVLGLGFSLIADIVVYRSSVLLRDRWFSVFRTNLTDAELQYFVWIVVGVFGVLSVLSALV